MHHQLLRALPPQQVGAVAGVLCLLSLCAASSVLSEYRPTNSCQAGIRLAGATSDVHIMDVRTGRWEKMAPHGEPPSPRAAHAAAAVGSMVVVQVILLQCTVRSHISKT